MGDDSLPEEAVEVSRPAPARGGSGGVRRRVALRRGQTARRTGQTSQQRTEDQFPSFRPTTTGRGGEQTSRLEVTQLDHLPSLRPVEEEDGDFGSFSASRQRSRGRQSRRRQQQ